MTALVAIALLATQGLDAKVTLEAKDALLCDILIKVSAESGYRITGPGFANNLKVTVFVKDMPAKDLLRRLADLYHFETQVKEERREFVLVLDQPTRMKLDDFIMADARYRTGLAENRLRALARLTAQPFDSYQPVDPAIKVDSYDSWARAKIVQPAFYAAGMWYGVNSARGSPSFSTHFHWVNSFWVGVPDPPRNPVRFPSTMDAVVAFVDSSSAQILGTQVAIAILESTGELRIKAVKGETEENDPYLDRPFAYSHPPSALASTRFATELRSWETPLDKVPLAIRDLPVRTAPKSKKESYYHDRIGLGEKLEDFFRRTSVPVIATSFRVPALSQKLAAASKAGDLLIDLASKEEAFLHWDQDCLLVRHPSYWALECTEPDERLLRRAEEIAKKRSLGLFEYADVAASLDDRRTSSVP